MIPQIDIPMWLLPYAAIVLTVIIILVIRYAGLRLANKNGADVRVVWYLFFLAFVVTWVVAGYATSTGAIDKNGVFYGVSGAYISKVLKFMLDLNTDINIFLSVLLVILGPQILGYLASGGFGCAAAPVFVGGVVRFCVWGIVKSFVVAAGIIQFIAFYGYFSHWIDWKLIGAASISIFSLMLLMLSFSILYVYRDIRAQDNRVVSNRVLRITKRLERLDRWFKRKL